MCEGLLIGAEGAELFLFEDVHGRKGHWVGADGGVVVVVWWCGGVGGVGRPRPPQTPILLFVFS